MVFKPFTYLARQNFSKAFTHGYAQSVVAASQSSYASSTTTFNQLAAHPAKFTRTNQLQNVFQNTSGSAAPGVKAGAGQTGSGSGGGGDFGLAAYYAAWQHAQQTGDDSDLRQIQLKSRFGWKPTVIAGEDDASVRSKNGDSLRKASVNVDVSAKVDEAVAREIEIQEEQSASATNKSSSQEQEEDSEASQSMIISERIVQLARTEDYAEIPQLFEAALRDGLTPTVDAYNALLVAAIHLIADPSQAVPKALDVYSDMLRHRILPNEKTYETLLDLVVSRADEVASAQEALEQDRARYGGMEEPGRFMLQSSELEHDILTEDHSLAVAVRLFNTATLRHAALVLPNHVYRHFISACAKARRVEDMIRIYAHMEAHNVVPHAAIFPPMIDAFAATGDLKSAVECYNEYRNLAVSDDSGIVSVVQRHDGQVYAALIRAYLSCGKEQGAQRFMEKIRESFEAVENGESRWKSMEGIITEEALIGHALSEGDFAQALEYAKDGLTGESLHHAMARVCTASADVGDPQRIAAEAYDNLPSKLQEVPAMAMLAMYVRQGNLATARSFWTPLSHHAVPDMIQPTVMYAVALLKSGQVEEGLTEARKMFARIRNSLSGNEQQQQQNGGVVRDQFSESLDLLCRLLMQSGTIISPQAAMTLLWSMVENGGLVSPAAEHAVASLGPMSISQLSVPDLTLALQIQAGMLLGGASSMLFDVAHPVRFAYMLEVALSMALPLDAFSMQLVDQAVAVLNNDPGLVKRWQDYIGTDAAKSPDTPLSSSAGSSDLSSAGMSSRSSSQDSFDPYAYATDFRGSAIIADQLENTNGRPETHIKEALMRVRNMSRGGRHPRYITYAKMITAAAKVNQMDLVHEIVSMARRDVPLLPEYSVVRYGWVSILDAMIAACLTLGDRSLGAKYHQELLDIGSAPSANTFGLYITTLKESTKTFDEATEALKIFHRAVAEGVEPTSFLYNALIGKLGKARRIDDCLLYFAEMRAKGVRPTSVTYGTVVNALCRVSDERFAEDMFEEMESMPNYKPRPAPYNSMIQYFLTTKRDRSKVLAYYERMRARGIQPTMHTYKLLIDAYASLEPVDMEAAESVLENVKSSGQHPEAVHYASLIHARGCVLNDMDSARKVFDSVVSNRRVRLQPCLYQALFEAMVANQRVQDTAEVLRDMPRRGVEMTAYIANTLIHGWAAEGSIENAKLIYDSVGMDKREPSTYEAMTRAFLAVDDHASAYRIVKEMLSRGYPAAVAVKIFDLVGGGR